MSSRAVLLRFSFLLASPLLAHPAFEQPRNPDAARVGAFQFLQPAMRVGSRRFPEGGNQLSDLGGKAVGDARVRRFHGGQPVAVVGKVDLDSRRAGLRGLVERPRAGPSQAVQHAFDVLAGSEAGHAEVLAGATVPQFLQIADFDNVGRPGGRGDLECSEMPELRLDVAEVAVIRDPPPPPSSDLVFIACLPAQEFRGLQFLCCVFLS